MSDPIAAQAKPVVDANAVTVRMYKGLLGDCFLLRLASSAGNSHILIDCGMLQGIPGAADRMKAVAADIVKTTGGKLDLLVVTHEHWDHISGFSQAADAFFGGALKIDTLWVAWTENDLDPQAQTLHARFDKAKAVVAAVAGLAFKLAEAGVTGADAVTAGLEAFIGPLDGALGAAAKPFTGRQILDDLKAAAGSVCYLEPGQVVETPGPTGLRAYVLGPPRNAARLFKSAPSAGDAKETYLGGDGLAMADHVMGALAAEAGAPDPDIPFPRRYRYPVPVAGAPPPDSDRDAAPAAWLTKTYLGGPGWRRIDADWLGGAGALALKLDSNTNNTSLVLAFETPAKRILLFAADAQVGNWLSWSDQDYPSPPPATASATDPPPVKLDSLLARTLVYKVGHHGSHNATLEAEGLELMTAPDLVAFLPLVESYARAPGRNWNMPYPDMYARLLKRTEGRVLRGDCKAGRDVDGGALTTDAQFLQRVADAPDGLYVEYTLPPEAIGTL